jgi:hypothetical protein
MSTFCGRHRLKICVAWPVGTRDYGLSPYRTSRGKPLPSHPATAFSP